MGIIVEADGSFPTTQRFLQKLRSGQVEAALRKYGPIGVQALASATPSKSGTTARAWTYEIVQDRGSYSIVWKNTHAVDGANIAILLQYGHGTGTGGYVQGRDYINPALRPIFDAMLADIRKVVSNR